MSEVDFLSIAELGAHYRRKSLSPVEVTRRAFTRIKALDGRLNAFITLLEKESLAEAATAERELMQGHDRGPLHGVPVAIKDLIAMAGAPTTFASRAGSPRHPDRDATLVKNLRQAGAVLIGKTNLLEYAYGAVHPEIGQTNNPWDPKRTSGGSSGGSAAGVASGMCFAAIGTDTGGSIRIPAAYCGVAGLKPSYGLVDLDGVQALSWSLDHAGPLARRVADAARLLEGMTGGSFPALPHGLKGLRLGIMDHPGQDRSPHAGRPHRLLGRVGLWCQHLRHIGYPPAYSLPGNAGRTFTALKRRLSGPPKPSGSCLARMPRHWRQRVRSRAGFIPCRAPASAGPRRTESWPSLPWRPATG